MDSNNIIDFSNNNLDNNLDNNNLVDEDIYVELLNTFILHYKRTYPEKAITSMFDNINLDDYSSTNHMIEMFYEEMLKYSDKIKNNELFGLSIDGDIVNTSNSIINLLLVIIEKYKSSNWLIINLK
jgi:hypothetical protein